jgi:hypothetical protein
MEKIYPQVPVALNPLLSSDAVVVAEHARDSIPATVFPRRFRKRSRGSRFELYRRRASVA